MDPQPPLPTILDVVLAGLALWKVILGIFVLITVYAVAAILMSAVAKRLR